MKTKTWLRIVSIVLSFVLCIQLCTTIVFAKEENDTSLEETEVAALLVGELTEKRSANEKHFLYDDGTIVAAVYPTAVHYQSEDGSWQDIDNRLTEAETDGNVHFENIDNVWKVKFAKKAKDGKLVRLKYGSHNISWSLADAQKTEGTPLTSPDLTDKPYAVGNVTSGILYKNILQNTDLEYQLLGENIKENLIIKSDDAPSQFTFIYETGHLEMVMEGKALLIKDGEQTIMTLDAPVMTDAALEESTNIALTLDTQKATPGNHIYALTVTPDAKWLKDAARVYPVTVDPQMSTEQNHASIEDTHVALSAPNDVRSDWSTIKVGMHGTSNVYRAYLKFTLPESIDVGNRVVNATLNLWPNTTLADLETMATKKPVIEAHEVTASWNKDTLTWTNKPAYDETVLDYDIIGAKGDHSAGRWYTWNITDLVDRWYITQTNYGIMLRYDSETAYGSNMVTNFVSAETNITAAAFPCIEISYINTLGLENYYTYHSVDVGDAGTAYINDFTGNMTLITPLAAVNSERAPLDVSLVYSPGSNNANINKLNVGGRFMLNVQAYIDTITDDNGDILRYKYVDGDGTIHYFAKNTADKWIDEENLGYELTMDSTYYTITAKDDSILRFHKSSGRLYCIADHNLSENGTRINCTRLSYDGEYLSSITNDTETITIRRYKENEKEHIEFTYPDSNGQNRYALIVLTEYNNHIENIFQYVMVNGVKTEKSRVGFQVGGSKLTAVVDGTGKIGAKFSYAAPSGNETRRVMSYSLREYLGNGNFDKTLYSYKISYGERSTKYTDITNEEDPRTELYTFDSLGRTITGQDTEKNAVFQSYGFSGGAENKITFSSKTQRFISNLARNHNFEKSGSGTPDWYFYGAQNDSYAIKGTALGEPTYLGDKAMKVYKHSDSSTAYATAKQSLSLKGGKVYTLSVYVKTAFTSVANVTGAGACIGIERLSSPVKQVYLKEIISASKFTRYNLTLDLSSVASGSYNFDIILGIIRAEGVAYFDCVQLEEGNSVNSYNAIENAGFENADDTISWVKQNMTADDTAVSATKHTGTRSFKVFGSPKLAKKMYQNIAVNGAANQGLTAGVWVKTATVPNKDTAEDGTKQSCSITLAIYHTDGSSQFETVTLDTACSEWRYICLGAVSKEAFSSVRLYLKYPYNCNTTYFDDACLFMDTFGEEYGYDKNNRGNLVSTIDLANNKTAITYTDDDEIASYTDAKGNKYSNTYQGDDPHLLATTTDPKGKVDRYTYNQYGLPTVVNTKSVGGLRMQSSTTYTNDGHFSLSSTDVNHISTSVEVDAQTGQVNKTHAPTANDGVIRDTLYTYDPLTKLNTKVALQTTDSAGTTTSLPANVTYAYNRGVLTDVVRLAGDTKQMGYHMTNDAFGRTTKIEWSGKGDTRRTLSQTAYLPQGVVGEMTYGNGQVLTYQYNKANLQTGVYYNNTQIKGFEYNANNALGYSWYLNNSGNKVGTRYFYDLAGRISATKGDNGYSTDNYTYDLNNNLTAYRSTLSDADVLSPYTTHYAYNASNQLTNMYFSTDVYDSGTTRYGYDGLGRLTNKIAVLSGTGDDAVGVRSSITYKTYTGTVDGNSATLRTLQPSTVNNEGTYNNIYLSTQYYNLYDADGGLSRMRIIETKDENTSDTVASDVTKTYVHYFYDSMGQLTKWKNTGAQASANVTGVDEYNYTYDNGGNITSANHLVNNAVEYTAAYTYDSDFSDLLTGYTKTFANGSVQSNTYTYDNFVNPTTITKTDSNGTETWNLSWEQGRQLASISIGADTITYDYDENGLRTHKKQADGSEYFYYYDGSRLEYVKILDANGNLTCSLHYVYNSSGQAEYILYRGASHTTAKQFDLFYILRDSEGKIHKLLQVRKKSGSSVAAMLEESVIYHYDPYGKLLWVEQPKGDVVGNYNPLIYKDYVYDFDTELYYLQSRYYDAEVGRFLNGDSILNQSSLLGFNLYTYCFNNPAGYRDLTGLSGNSIQDEIKAYLCTPNNVFSNIVSGTEIAFGVVEAAWISGINSATKAANVGVGTFNKIRTAERAAATNMGQTATKLCTAASYASVAFDVGIGVYDNIQVGASEKKIILDATVDVAVSGLSVWAAGALGSKIGCAVGSVYPGLGNAVGAVAGFAIGITLYAVTDVIKYNGKTARSWLKEGVNSL